MKHIIFVTSFLFSLFLLHPAYALTPTAALRVVPSGQAGDTLTVDVRLDTDGQAVGGIEAFVQYSDTLEFLGSDDTDSVMDQEVIPVQPKGEGAVEFVRLRFDEGFSGEDGYIVGLTFRIVDIGETFIRIEAQGSQVIAFEDSSNILQSGHGIKANIPAIPAPGSDTVIATEEMEEGEVPAAGGDEGEMAGLWESTVEEVVQEMPAGMDDEEEELLGMGGEDADEEEGAMAGGTGMQKDKQAVYLVGGVLGLGIVLVALVLLFRKKKGATSQSNPPAA